MAETSKYIGKDGCHYDTEAEAMYSETGLCFCGTPEHVHSFIIECLKSFTAEEGKFVSGVEQLVKEKPGVAAELISQFLNSVELLEHGGSIYGAWLTEFGTEFIECGPMDFGQ